ncbi:MAG: hypothetical protein HUU38_04980 [Anaerolineales bacterium]|nr:hypothetical protein [Anaerolineales bacterium]
MLNSLKQFLKDCKGEMDEAVFVYPLLLVIAFGLVNLAMVGFAGVNAANAANYGARMGSVSQENPQGTAATSANEMIAVAPVGTYTVSVQGNGNPGGAIRVFVSYSVPNYFAGPASFFGISLPTDFEGTATSIFRQEGW